MRYRTINLWVALLLAWVGTSLPAEAHAEAPAELTPAAKAERATTLVGAMGEMLQRANAAFDEASATNDVDRMGRLRDVVVAMRGLLKLSESNLVSMGQALKAGDDRRVQSEYVKILIAHEKCLELDADVKSVTSAVAGLDPSLDGQDQGAGGTTVDSQADADVPQVAPESGVQAFDVLLDRPPSASGAL